jgi:hypothetical protein
MPSVSTLYMDPVLTNVSIDYKNDDYYAERLFPPVEVPKQSGRFWKFGKERFTLYETIRHAKALTREIGPWTAGFGTYFCDDHALKDGVADEEAANATVPLDIRVTQLLSDAILLDLEVRVKNLVLTSSLPGTSLSGAAQWNTSTSNPVADVELGRTTIKKSVAAPPNTLLVSYPVHLALRQNSNIINRFVYTNMPGGFPTNQQLASVFEVDNYWVAGAEFSTKNEGLDPSGFLDFVWGKNALLCRVSGAQQLDVSLGFEFRWLWGPPDVGGLMTKRYRVEEKCMDAIEVHRYDDIQIADPNAGYLIQTAIA